MGSSNSTTLRLGADLATHISNLAHRLGLPPPQVARAALVRGLDDLSVEEVHRLAPSRKPGWPDVDVEQRTNDSLD